MKKILLITSLALSLYSSGVLADDVTQPSGIYGTLSGGWLNASTPSAPQSNTVNYISNKNYTYGFNLGGQYAFTDNWAGGIEIGALTLGNINYKKNSTSTTTSHFPNVGLQAMAVASYMMSNGFNTFVKGGALAALTSINTNYANGNNLTPLTIIKNEIHYMPAAAVGIGYMPLQNFNIGLQYERAFDNHWHANLATLNLTYVLPL